MRRQARAVLDRSLHVTLFLQQQIPIQVAPQRLRTKQAAELLGDSER
jgi:hypothetical protein